MLTWIEAHPNLASWLQAIGAIIAIAIAIWVPYLQRRQALEAMKAAELDQVRHVLRNLLDEMIVITSGFKEGNGKKLMEVIDGQPFDVIIPIMEQPFPIFDAAATKLGLIQSDELRRHIINAYGRANGFISSVRLNNALVDRFDEAAYLRAVHNDDVHERLFLARQQRLVEYARALKKNYIEATEKMLAMRTAIEHELGIA